MDLRRMTTDLQALADFLPVFRKPTFKAGEWAGRKETAPGVFEMPYVNYDPVADAFVKAAYEHGWVMPDFDWPAWVLSAEARSLRDDETVLSIATPEQLAQLLTICIRQDRFVEGALMVAFDSGLMLRIVERAAALVADLASSDGEGG